MALGNVGTMPKSKELARVRRMAATGAARAIRESAHVSLREVAADVGVDVSSLSRWETGVRQPRGSAAIRWLRILEELG